MKANVQEDDGKGGGKKGSWFQFALLGLVMLWGLFAKWKRRMIDRHEGIQVFRDSRYGKRQEIIIMGESIP